MLKGILVLIATLLGLTIFFVANEKVIGQVQSCEASVTPKVLSPGSSASLQFNIHNTSGEGVAFQWVRIIRASSDYDILDSSLEGWDAITQVPTHTTQTGNYIDQDQTVTMTVTANVANRQATSANWIVQVSDDSEGFNLVICTGDLSTSISAPASSGGGSDNDKKP